MRLAQGLTRIDFLRGRFSERETALRPPWSLGGTGFTDTCGRSGACIAACPEKILISGSGGFPEVDFGRGECTFCGDCAEACRSGALARSEEDAVPWTLEAAIGPGCLAMKGVVCRLCEENCEATAIRFRLVVGGAPRPAIEMAACSGCGACVSSCPVNAITVTEARP